MENGIGRSTANDLLKEKSYAFSLRVINAYKYLTDERREYVMSKQFLRSGTSIGANTVEAKQAQSKADFVHKLSISLKEAFETQYWLEVLRDSQYLPEQGANSPLLDCSELQKILTASIKTAKSRLK